jgi:hypothetical protein
VATAPAGHCQQRGKEIYHSQFIIHHFSLMFKTMTMKNDE